VKERKATAYRLDPEIAQIRKAIGDACKIPNSVAIRILEGSWIDLVDNPILPPGNQPMVHGEILITVIASEKNTPQRP
jgi:hypothetical protein